MDFKKVLDQINTRRTILDEIFYTLKDFEETSSEENGIFFRKFKGHHDTFTICVSFDGSEIYLYMERELSVFHMDDRDKGREASKRFTAIKKDLEDFAEKKRVGFAADESIFYGMGSIYDFDLYLNITNEAEGLEEILNGKGFEMSGDLSSRLLVYSNEGHFDGVGSGTIYVKLDLSSKELVFDFNLGRIDYDINKLGREELDKLRRNIERVKEELGDIDRSLLYFASLQRLGYRSFLEDPLG